MSPLFGGCPLPLFRGVWVQLYGWPWACTISALAYSWTRFFYFDFFGLPRRSPFFVRTRHCPFGIYIYIFYRMIRYGSRGFRFILNFFFPFTFSYCIRDSSHSFFLPPMILIDPRHSETKTISVLRVYLEVLRAFVRTSASVRV